MSPSVFPIFDKAGTASTESSFRWITPALGPKRSCLHGVNHHPKSSPKVAAFDLDGCLIQGSFPKKGTPPKFEWWRPIVPQKLKQAHEEGQAPPLAPIPVSRFAHIFLSSYSIVIITNQALRTQALINDWKKKIPLIANAVRHLLHLVRSSFGRA